VFARNKQLSTTPTEAVAETFCHLFSLSWEKLTEMRSFYENDLLPPATVTPVRTPPNTMHQPLSDQKNDSSEQTVTSPQHEQGQGQQQSESSPLPNEENQSPARPTKGKTKARRKQRPSFSSSLHDNHELRRMTCDAIAAVNSEEEKMEDTEENNIDDDSTEDGVAGSGKRRGSTLSSLPVIMDGRESATTSRRVEGGVENDTTSRRRISDGEVRF
jgi:hypothetical protein